MCIKQIYIRNQSIQKQNLFTIRKINDQLSLPIFKESKKHNENAITKCSKMVRCSQYERVFMYVIL